MKKLALVLLTISCVYTSSHGMLARHAHRVRVFNQIKKSHHNIAKRFCSTNTTKPKSGFLGKLFWVLTGGTIVHALYENKVGETIQQYGTLECPYKIARDKIYDRFDIPNTNNTNTHNPVELNPEKTEK